MGKRIGLWAFVVAGLALAVWGVVTWVAPSAVCRGVDMQPGDVCSYSSYTETGTDRVQSYEERIAAARSAAPIVVVLGLAAAGFGTYVARRARPKVPAQASSDIGP